MTNEPEIEEWDWKAGKSIVPYGRIDDHARTTDPSLLYRAYELSADERQQKARERFPPPLQTVDDTVEKPKDPRQPSRTSHQLYFF